MDPEKDEQLVIAMRAAARALAQRPSIRDLEVTLAQIVASAVRTIPAVEAGSISMTEGGQVRPATRPARTSASSTTSEPAQRRPLHQRHH